MSNGSARSPWEEAVSWLREQPDQAELVRDCYYDRPIVAAAMRFHQSEEWRAVRCWFPTRVGKALDLGAGHGIASYALAADGWAATALEPDLGRVVGVGAIRELSNATGLPIAVVAQRGESMPFVGKSFDLVYARQVLHHASDLRRLCSEVHRVLRPGGILVATRDHVVSSRDELHRFLRSHPLHARYGGECAYTMNTYLSAVRGAGLVTRKVYRALDTVVNFAPYTHDRLRHELSARIRGLPGRRFLLSMLGHEGLFALLLRALSRLDRRPGRLVSIVAARPEEDA